MPNRYEHLVQYQFQRTSQLFYDIKVASSKDSLLKEVRRLASIANKRIARLEKLESDTGIKAFGARYIRGEDDTLTRFRANKKMSITELRHVYSQEIKFINARTTTVAGEKRYREELKRSMTNMGINITGWTSDDYNEYWNLVHKTEKLMRDEGRGSMGSSTIVDLVTNYVNERGLKGTTAQEVVSVAKSQYDILYRKKQDIDDEWLKIQEDSENVPEMEGF